MKFTLGVPYAVFQYSVSLYLNIQTEGDALTFDVELCVPLPETAKPGGEPGVMRTLNLGV